MKVWRSIFNLHSSPAVITTGYKSLFGNYWYMHILNCLVLYANNVAQLGSHPIIVALFSYSYVQCVVLLTYIVCFPSNVWNVHLPTTYLSRFSIHNKLTLLPVTTYLCTWSAILAMQCLVPICLLCLPIYIVCSGYSHIYMQSTLLTYVVVFHAYLISLSYLPNLCTGGYHSSKIFRQKILIDN